MLHPPAGIRRNREDLTIENIKRWLQLLWCVAVSGIDQQPPGQLQRQVVLVAGPQTAH